MSRFRLTMFLLRAARRSRAELARLWNLTRPVERARARIVLIRGKLMSLGLTGPALAELERIVATDRLPQARGMAAQELAVWHMRQGTPEARRVALGLIERAWRLDPDPVLRRQLATAEVLCLHALGERDAARAALGRARDAGDMTADALLIATNLDPTPEGRVARINEVLEGYGIPALALRPGDGAAYDRLTSAVPLAPVTGGPKVTVLLAAFDAAGTLPTALRSLGEQTWTDLEILVIDDASPSGEMREVAGRFAAQDPRIRYIRMDRNGGAYAARNRGLDEATGTYVTIHDADDWAHPQRIEAQVRAMEANPGLMGCFSEQARCLGDLSFVKFRADGSLVGVNTSSFLFRREPVRAALGYWDTVRFGADNELVRRVQKVFGEFSVRKLRTGPLSFQRDSASSVTSDPIRGIHAGAHYYGVRREYFNAQRRHHATATSLRYGNDPAQRPFPVPPMMRPDAAPGPDRFDVVFCGEFRRATPEVLAMVREVGALRDAGRRVGLVEVFDYALDLPMHAGPIAQVRELVDGSRVRLLVYGEDVVTDRVVELSPRGGQADQRFLPRIAVAGRERDS